MSSRRRTSLRQERQRRRSSISQKQQQQLLLENHSGLDGSSCSLSSSSQQGRRNSSTRRNSQSPSAMQDLNLHLGRKAAMEVPTNKRERHQRRASRKEDYERLKSHRDNRMSSLQDQWTSHRQQLFSDEDEFNQHNGGRKVGGGCCGWDLCCPW